MAGYGSSGSGGYVNARYSPHDAVTAVELDWLGGHVAKLWGAGESGL